MMAQNVGYTICLIKHHLQMKRSFSSFFHFYATLTSPNMKTSPSITLPPSQQRNNNIKISSIAQADSIINIAKDKEQVLLKS